MLRVVLLASVDAVVRDVASLSIACDLPAGVEVRHDLFDGNQLRCTVSDQGGLVHELREELDHGCLSCAVREGLIPTLAWVRDQGRWDAVVVALPVTAGPASVAFAVETAIEDGTLEGV